MCHDCRGKGTMNLLTKIWALNNPSDSLVDRQLLALSYNGPIHFLKAWKTPGEVLNTMSGNPVVKS